MESNILEYILSNQGSVDIELLYNLFDASTLQLGRKNDKFVSCLRHGQPKVVVRSRVKLCRAKDCHGCGGLHLCKDFLFTGSCQLEPDNIEPDQTRRVCRFSHNLDSDYNERILQEFGLETLTRTELCVLLLQSDNTLLPSICQNYNNVNGCQEDCQRLHICERFLSRDCSCFRTHDFYAPQPLKRLHEKRIPDNIIKTLKSVYANKQAVRLADENNPEMNFPVLPVHSPNTGSVSSNMRSNRNITETHVFIDKTEICMFFIDGHCKYEDRCFKTHDKMPYRWEIKLNGKWTPMDENERIEKDYCDPQNTYSTNRWPVYFDTMTCGNNEVRRLSTMNSVLDPDSLHTTEWLWYWEEVYGHWNQFAAVTSEHQLGGITSRDLEERFVQNNKDVVQFTAGSQTYELSFQDMIQTNLKYVTKRVVKRRPQFVSAAEVQTKRKLPALLSTAVPDYWNKTQISPTGYKRVTLQPTSGEYNEIQQLFCQTMKNFDILQIERIQNKSVWEAFQLHRNHMKNKSGGQPVTEKKLFHGTDPKFVDTICSTNFDWRVCGVNGTSYGQGSYFARDASYSHKYTGHSDVRFMFVSRVLVGDYTKGSSEYRRPPSKDGGDVNLYDSCVNDIFSPSIFVVFHQQQIYPEYLLQYQDMSRPATYFYPPLFNSPFALPHPTLTPPSTFLKTHVTQWPTVASTSFNMSSQFTPAFTFASASTTIAPHTLASSSSTTPVTGFVLASKFLTPYVTQSATSVASTSSNMSSQFTPALTFASASTTIAPSTPSASEKRPTKKRKKSHDTVSQHK